MTPVIVGVIGVVVLFLLLFSQMPVALGLGFVGFAGLACLGGFSAALATLKLTPYATFASYDLSVIPLFVLMGTFCFYAQISKDLYYAAYKWLGHFPGGLAMATTGACAAFGAVTGSSIAAAATMGMITLPEMRRYNYDPALATGSLAASATLALMIPPSLSFIVYGIITGQSIGKLFIAGIIPGIILAIFYMATIFTLCKRNPLLGPQGPGASFMQKIVSLKGTWIVLLLFVIVIGGIYLGVFTPTEAAGIGAFGTFVFGLARRQLGWQNIKNSLVDTSKTTGMVFLIIMGAMIFSYFLTVSTLPPELARIMGGLPVSRYIILAGMIVVYLFLGCLLESLSLILLATPIFYPCAMALGFNPIWFGVLVTLLIEFGLITPPVGLNVYVISGIVKGVPMYTIFRGMVPFLIAGIFFVVLLIAFPQLATWLPSMMK